MHLKHTSPTLARFLCERDTLAALACWKPCFVAAIVESLCISTLYYIAVLINIYNIDLICVFILCMFMYIFCISYPSLLAWASFLLGKKAEWFNDASLTARPSTRWTRGVEKRSELLQTALNGQVSRKVRKAQYAILYYQRWKCILCSALIRSGPVEYRIRRASS